MSTNNKISNLVSSQLPGFVRDDHPNFINFIKAYYQWMEQNGETIERIKNIKSQIDIDTSVDIFTEELHRTFLNLMPTNSIITDKAMLLKHIKDFYRARGTEKSVEFLLRILFGSEADKLDFYYPKKDILRASDGKWFIEKSLKFANTYIDGIANTDIVSIKNAFEHSLITGNTSGATAIVERVDTYYDAATLIREIKLSNQTRDFVSGESIFALYDREDGTHTISANTFSGIINKINILKSGTGYVIGDTAVIESNTGSGGIIQVTDVSKGNIKSVYVVYGGAGFQNNMPILFAGGGGSGANANVSIVLDNSHYHPNSYNVVYSMISLEANTPINNTIYSNLVSAITDPANDSISNSMSYFTFANTGPAVFITILQTGNNYLTSPTTTIVANTRIQELGILGRMEINNAGLNYANGEMIIFDNVSGGYGTGASANVTVNANGSIIKTTFEQVPGFQIGGQGYNQSYLPIPRIVTSGGTGANIAVTAILGQGEILRPVSDTLGAIKALTIISGGSGYETVPTINLTSIGDGTAQANVTIVTGAYTYPGRYLNDDGFLSAYNFLEDRDYYQNFSYVIRLNQSIDTYRKYLKDLLHPAGMKLFGEYLFVDEMLTLPVQPTFQDISGNNIISVTGTYVSTANANGSTIEITTTRDMSNTTLSYIEFTSGNAINSIANLSNGIYTVIPNTINSIILIQANNTVNGSGNVYISI